MEEKEKQGVSRRSFLKSTAAGAGAIATGGGLLAGQKALAQSESTDQPGKYSWETPPAPIPDSQIKEKVTADILVIGCGISGITAALSANE